jgi:D-beta-D-heptose 7-phosphate kinase/D-beta-D-heptose 1-phosphate adenosyltransferase
MNMLPDLITRLAGRRVAVVGDVMLDHFLFGHVDRISPEAPVPVVKFDHDEYRLGGAANVARNVTTLGGQALLVGLAGDDDTARLLRQELNAATIDDANLVVDVTRATTRKLRIVTSRNQQVARVDYELETEASGAVLESLRKQVAVVANGAHAIVLSDYGKGVVGAAVIAAAATAAKSAGIPLVIDPKLPQANRYRGATLITPNLREAELMTLMTIRTTVDARKAARLLNEKSGASVIITWGEHGMWVLDASLGTLVEEALPAVTREVADVTGAGDTVAAVLALALAAGARLGDAARLANLAASLAVTRFGPATISTAELRAVTPNGGTSI